MPSSMRVDYRALARQRVEEARAFIADEGMPSHYAALALRMALEAMIYGVASNYTDDLPPAHARWQAGKLLEQLLAIDPMCDLTFVLKMEDPEREGEDKFVEIGTDRRISLTTVKRHYDALGNFVHTPTLAQTDAGKIPDEGKRRARCVELLEKIDHALQGTMWNFSFNWNSEIDCMRCGEKLKRRVVRLHQGPFDKAEYVEVKCHECDAAYKITKEENSYLWHANVTRIPCRNPQCVEVLHIWSSDLVAGKRIECKACGTVNRVDFAISNDGPTNTKPILVPVTGRLP